MSVPAHFDTMIENTLSSEVLARIEAPTAEGSGLPNVCYTSADWLQLENERLFAKTWMLAGFCHEIPHPGDAHPITVAGLPLLLLRDHGSEVRVFHNVCQHRGAMLVNGDCILGERIVCPYHAWSYGLDGTLRSRPHFFGGGEHDLSPGASAPDLVPVRHAIWNDLIFVDLSGEAAAFGDHWAPFSERMRQYDFSSLRYAHTLDFDIKGNWKLVYENFCDPYHVERIHPRLNKYTPMSKRPAILTDRHWLYSTLPIDDPRMGRGEPTMPYYPGLDTEGQHTEWFYHLFPTTCFQLWPDQLSVFQLHPVAADRTIEHIHMYFVGDAATDPEFIEGRQSVYDMWHQLNTEDFTVVESMQVARNSPAFTGGVLSPYWDVATQHLARLLVDAIHR